MSDAITPFVPASIEQAANLADRLSKSGLLPDTLRGKPTDILVVLMTGHELGLSPMQALRGLYVVKGKATMSADLMVALVKKHPACIYFKLIGSESGDKQAVYETERKGEGPTRMVFTMDQAKQAQLTGNPSWSKFPAAMLRARCSSALARAVYPDLTLGVYDPEELESGIEPVPPPVSVERDITPPAEPKKTATEKVKAQLKAKESKTVDAEPAKEAKEGPSPRERIQAMFVELGIEKERWQNIVKEATGKTREVMTDADVEAVADALRYVASPPPPEDEPRFPAEQETIPF